MAFDTDIERRLFARWGRGQQRPHLSSTQGTMMAWMHPTDPIPDDADDEDDEANHYEPIDLDGLKLVCKSHKHGAAMLAVGAGCIAGGAEICLIDREHDKRNGSIFIGYWWGPDAVSKWFTCWLRDEDWIEASVSTATPEPYIAFFQQNRHHDWSNDGSDSKVVYFHEPVEETGRTLVRFYMPASDPIAPSLILKFYNCTTGESHDSQEPNP